MAFRFGDPGGRGYTSVGTSNVNAIAWWGSVNQSSGTFSVSAATGRTTGSSLRFVWANNATLFVSRSFDAQATWGVAFAVKFTAVNTFSVPMLAVAFVDVATNQCELRFNTDGSLSVTRNATNLGTTASGLITPNTWNHIEFKVTIHPSAGTAQVWVNGVSKLSLTSQNTRATANSTAGVVNFGSVISIGGPTLTADWDDIIIYDGQATDVAGNADITGPIGDCGLSWLLPTGAGTTTQFTPDSGSNYARVNEATPDGNTSYVESSTVGQIDTYATTDLAGTVTTVKSVAIVHYAEKTDVGSRGMAAEIRSNGVNYQHATTQSLGNSYLYYFSGWGCDPNTAIAWTIPGVNALEIGQTVVS